MGRLLYIICLSMLFTTVNAADEGIQFFEGSWEEAVALAQKEGKPIFVDAYAVWCGPCKRMAKQVFTQKEVGDFYNEHFINVKMDMERGEGPLFGRKFPVSAFPTLFYISPDQEILKKKVGGLPTKIFLQLGEQVIRNFGDGGKSAELYNEGNRSFDVVLAYIKALNTQGEPSLKIANDYLLKHADTLSEKQVRAITFEAVSEADSKLFEKMMEDKKAFQKDFGEESVATKAKAACEKTVEKAVEFRYVGLVDEAVEKYESFAVDRADAEAFKYASYMNYHQAAGEYEPYMKYAVSYLKTEEGKSIESKIKVASVISKNFPKAGQEDAIELWKQIVKEEEKAPYYFKLAQLYKQAGNTKKARKSAEQALEMGKSKGINIVRYQDFLNTL